MQNEVIAASPGFLPLSLFLLEMNPFLCAKDVGSCLTCQYPFSVGMVSSSACQIPLSLPNTRRVSHHTFIMQTYVYLEALLSHVPLFQQRRVVLLDNTLSPLQQSPFSPHQQGRTTLFLTGLFGAPLFLRIASCLLDAPCFSSGFSDGPFPAGVLAFRFWISSSLCRRRRRLFPSSLSCFH